jgi:hypothetical protein
MGLFIKYIVGKQWEIQLREAILVQVTDGGQLNYRAIDGEEETTWGCVLWRLYHKRY